MKSIFVLAGVLTLCSYGCTTQDPNPDYLDPDLTFDERAKDLVSRLTLEEKVAQMSNDAPAIERLGVPEFNYQGEALHGIAEAAGGKYMPATSFPQSIAMGSTWDPDLMRRVATAILLRDEWGFKGYVVSDCGAIGDIYENHKYVVTPEEACALAVRSGCDLNCGFVYEDALLNAVKQGLVSEEHLDTSVQRLFLARFKLGMFTDPEDIPYTSIGPQVVESDEHRELALEAARKSIILLKNENNALPLSVHVEKLAVMGPNADNPVLGAYSGKPTRRVSVLQGLRERLGDRVWQLPTSCPENIIQEENYLSLTTGLRMTFRLSGITTSPKAGPTGSVTGRCCGPLVTD